VELFWDNTVEMFAFLIKLISIGLIFLLCDLPWLWASSYTVQPMVKKIQGGMPIELRWGAAVPVYLALAYLLQISTSTQQAGLIGLSTYAVYDFTNLATLKHYTVEFAVADSLWGGILFMITREVCLRLGLL
jgi:uncharacterized membrane protein